MSYKTDYINSLTLEELREVASRFWDLGDFENGCPLEAGHVKFPCQFKQMDLFEAVFHGSFQSRWLT